MPDYEQKYLKYKNKYLTLKSNLEAQTGGNYYMDGYYVFFIYDHDYSNPDNTVVPNDDYKKDQHYGRISMDNFTSKKINNCSMFFRISDGKLAFNRNDSFNTYNTVYPNISNIYAIAPKFSSQAENTCPFKSFRSSQLPISSSMNFNLDFNILKSIIDEMKTNIADKSNNFKSILVVRNTNGYVQVRARYKVVEGTVTQTQEDRTHQTTPSENTAPPENIPPPKPARHQNQNQN